MRTSWIRIKGIIGLTRARMGRSERYAAQAVDDCLELIRTELELYFQPLKCLVPAIAGEFVRTRNYQAIQDFLKHALDEGEVKKLSRRIADEIRLRQRFFGFNVSFKTGIPQVAVNDHLLADYCGEAVGTLRISALVSDTNRAGWSGALSRVAPALDLRVAGQLLDFEDRLLRAAGCDLKAEQQRLVKHISARLTGILENGRRRIERELSRQVIEEIYAQYEDREKKLKKRIHGACLALGRPAAVRRRRAS